MWKVQAHIRRIIPVLFHNIDREEDRDGRMGTVTLGELNGALVSCLREESAAIVQQFATGLARWEESGLDLEEFVSHFTPMFCCLRDGVQARASFACVCCT